MRNNRVAAVWVAAGLALAASPASAAFHLMRIVQVYGGDVSHPDAQYVVLQMCIAGQNLVGGHAVGFFDDTGAAIGSPVTFAGNVANGASQARILVATSSAETLFGLAADLRMPANLLIAGGKTCFEPGPSPIDCLGWGAYSALPDPSIGIPYDILFGLPPGSAVQRDLSVAGGSSTLDCTSPTDDTNDSADDFDPAIPNPGNNGGATGVVDPDHIFFHAFEGGTSSGWSSVVN